MSRHFVGLAALGASYRLNMKTRFLHGIMAGVGATYGYAFVLNKNWNMEAEIGVGIAYVYPAIETGKGLAEKPTSRVM